MKSCRLDALPGEAFCALHMKSCPRAANLSGAEPAYEPKRWNQLRELRESHNCFSYAMNVNDPSQVEKCSKVADCNIPFHQPGIAAGYKGFVANKPKTCPNLTTRILGENPNIRMTTFEAKCPKDTSKIALIIDESDDYHFLRQDSNGYWSHKPGARAVTNVDASKHKIWDPQLCDFNYTKEGVLNYDVFCSFSCVPRTTPVFLRASGGRRKTRRLGRA